MSENNLRKIKEVNGWRVNHPHSGPNIFYTICTLIIAALPVAYLFMPIVQLSIDFGFTVLQFNGIELVKVAIEFIKFIAGQPANISNPAFPLLFQQEFVGPTFAQTVGQYMIIASAAVFLLLCVFSAVLLILFFVILIKGYLKHSGVIKVFTILGFIFSILFAGVYVVLFFGYMSTDVHKFKSGFFIFWRPLYVCAAYFGMSVVISAVRSAFFKDSIPEKELEIQPDGPSVEHVTKVHGVTKLKYEQSSTLPPNLTSIGGHAFAENQNLIVANIPVEVTKIGNSAFANCLKLKVVSIPDSVIEIGFNCFFNCVELERINYSGTKEQWKKIARGSNWLAKAKTSEVTCIDGVIIVNPYH